MFLEPIREPGTRFAIEHHGGKAGRFWGFEKVELDDMILFRPRMCPHCKREAVVFDQRDFPLLSGLWKRALPGSSGPAGEEIQAGYREIQEVESSEER